MKDALSKVQTQVGQVRGELEGCATDLVTLEAVIARQLSGGRLPAVFGGVLAKHRQLGDRLRQAMESLAGLSRALDMAVHFQGVEEAKLAAVLAEEEAARREPFHDPLTGLATRTLFNNRLEHGLLQAQRRNWSLAVMWLDLDGLREVNSAFGRDVGDAVLQTTARRLKVSTRGEDSVGRGEGSEFFYLLMDFRDEQNIAMIADRIVAALQEPCSITSGARTVRPTVTVSIGIAIYPKDGSTPATITKAAQQALTRAKRHTTRIAFAS